LHSFLPFPLSVSCITYSHIPRRIKKERQREKKGKKEKIHNEGKGKRRKEN
jgi:hypothetical protein